MISTDGTDDKVSIVLAVRNEARHLRAVIESLLEQDRDGFSLELLVLDGGSTDGSRELVSNLCLSNPNLFLIDNPGKTAPHAFNLGLQRSTGNYVAIFGAHAIYADNYVLTCLREIKLHRAAGASGRILLRPANSSLQAQLICWLLSHPFGTSGRSFRNHPQGYAHTLPYAVFNKAALQSVGGYDVSLTRNQDNDTNQRLVAAGHKLYYSWKTEAFYSPKANIGEILEYARNTGYWNVLSWRHQRASMSWYHFVPLLFIVSLLCLLLVLLSALLWPRADGTISGVVSIAALAGFLGIVTAHILGGFVASCQIAIRERRIAALLLPLLFFLLHVAYGWGSLAALLNGARVPADNPVVHP